jgi:hypothetical protein
MLALIGQYAFILPRPSAATSGLEYPPIYRLNIMHYILEKRWRGPMRLGWIQSDRSLVRTIGNLHGWRRLDRARFSVKSTLSYGGKLHDLAPLSTHPDRNQSNDRSFVKCVPIKKNHLAGKSKGQRDFRFEHGRHARDGVPHDRNLSCQLKFRAYTCDMPTVDDLLQIIRDTAVTESKNASHRARRAKRISDAARWRWVKWRRALSPSQIA